MAPHDGFLVRLRALEQSGHTRPTAIVTTDCNNLRWRRLADLLSVSRIAGFEMADRAEHWLRTQDPQSTVPVRLSGAQLG